HSIKLLNHYEIKKPLISYHEHNEKTRAPELIGKLFEGQDIGLVSDAGMPGISDPGQNIIRLAIEEGIEVIALHGATAVITALVASDLYTEKFVFEGFLPSKKRQRQEELENLKTERRTIILYESPYRLLDTLKDILDIMGNRQIALARELTKLHEEIFRGNVSQGIDKFSSRQIKGEFVIVIGGSREEEKTKEIHIKEELKKYIDEGYTKKSSIKIVSEKYDIPKNQVYKESLRI